MPTVETKIWLALRTRMAALVMDPAVPVQWPGESETIPAGNSFEVHDLVNQPIRLFLNGSDPHRRTGILQISVLTEPGELHHEIIARELAGTVAEHFPADLAMPYDDVVVKVTEAPHVASGFHDTARVRWVTPVSVRYEAFV